ncbi:hypothetical protein MJT46_012507, partial [Ovis ammon polii x Ovis aries]
VPRPEASTFTASHHVAYFEASAKLRLNVDEAFEQLVRADGKSDESASGYVAYPSDAGRKARGPIAERKPGSPQNLDLFQKAAPYAQELGLPYA